MEAMILAGGVGSRLWPISTPEMPKQFIKFTDKSFFQEALIFAHNLCQRITVVSVEEYRGLAHTQALEVNVAINSFVSEPEAKGTCPAIAIGCLDILQKSGDDDMLILPADHHIADRERFTSYVKSALGTGGWGEKICLFGYNSANLALSEYGVIVTDWAGNSTNMCAGVGWFIEKPQYLQDLQRIRDKQRENSNHVLINCGIFLTRPLFLLRLTASHAPEVFGVTLSPSAYANIRPTSFDREILQDPKVDKYCVNVTGTGWSDVGSFSVLRELFPDVIEQDFIQRARVNGLPVPDHDGDVIEKPWGWYRVLGEGEGWKVKLLHVNPNHGTSLQFHRNRAETWKLIDGEALCLVGDIKYVTRAASPVRTVAPLVHHRITNESIGPVEIIEIQTGAPDEEDIVRLQDSYAREQRVAPLFNVRKVDG